MLCCRPHLIVGLGLVYIYNNPELILILGDTCICSDEQFASGNHLIVHNLYLTIEVERIRRAPLCHSMIYFSTVASLSASTHLMHWRNLYFPPHRTHCICSSLYAMGCCSGPATEVLAVSVQGSSTGHMTS